MLWKILLAVTGAAIVAGGALLTPVSVAAGYSLMVAGGALLDRAVAM